MPRETLTAHQLRPCCSSAEFDFQTTADLEPLSEALGQERALEAIRFALDMPQRAYNLFLLGPRGTGKQVAARELLEQRAKVLGPARDWVYVNNFDDPRCPCALSLPAGRGPELAAAMRTLVEDVSNAVPTLLEQDQNQRRLAAAEDEFRQRQEDAFEKLREEAREHGIALLRTPTGFAFAPMQDDKVLSAEEYAAVSEDERKRLEARSDELHERLRTEMQNLPQWEKERREAIRELFREVVVLAIEGPMAQIRSKFEGLDEIQAFFERVRDDLTENVHALIEFERNAQSEGSSVISAMVEDVASGFTRYRVNSLVTHTDTDMAPIVHEDHPTLARLVGRVEQASHEGTSVTDFTMIKAGALHRANGGFLILDVESVLREPFSWQALKRCLRAGRVEIESGSELLSLTGSVSLAPDPIPLNVKVVLYGERWMYGLLAQHDSEFSELFRVAADFDESVTYQMDGLTAYARLIAGIVATERALPFDGSAVARIVDFGRRELADNRKLLVQLEPLRWLIQEVDHYARRIEAKVASGVHVEAALLARERRSDRMRERSREVIERDIVRIATHGAEVGQVNGMSVVAFGEFSFGRPARISATARMGAGKLLDIEREVELGGPIHSKGVLILSGFLGSRFLPGEPLSLAASIAFEQSYGGVDGDSASAAELCALLSAIAEIPIEQRFAVTGSVDQGGRVQAVGGVNEKIEGFFGVCRDKGLTGVQGVVLPRANLDHLMLDREVVDAVAEGRFHVHVVDDIDSLVELLMGRPAGVRGPDGQYPDGSVYAAVESRLQTFAKRRDKAIAEARRELGEGESR